MKPRVFIAIPNLGSIRTELCLALLRWVASGRYQLRIFMPMHVCPHHRARNVCIREFLQDEYDWLLFIDSDHAPPSDALERLLAHGADFVSGVVLTWKDGAPVPVAFRWDEERGGYVPHYGSGLTPVDVTTLGFTLLSRRLVESMPKAPCRFEDNADGTDGYGEEFVFCREAKRLGWEVYCDYGLLVGHKKEIELLEVNGLLVRRVHA